MHAQASSVSLPLQAPNEHFQSKESDYWIPKILQTSLSVSINVLQKICCRVVPAFWKKSCCQAPEKQNLKCTSSNWKQKYILFFKSANSRLNRSVSPINWNLSRHGFVALWFLFFCVFLFASGSLFWVFVLCFVLWNGCRSTLSWLYVSGLWRYPWVSECAWHFGTSGENTHG